eukprot:CAMPEP_0178439628 /NCGR_PEP_ID=MMETSP0689_2-20121128/36265_1 /TAXON_ID=160604 /ORGANISM="Amphidinium massartii, Strain CS-259" /LENGTH=710 /DNA_ID=CAMNT_0020062185 /DNA_START=46 /DNA_END=2174 /DNA_ORIENTATION=+
MGKSSVRVVLRARPTANFASENFQFNEGTDSVDMRLPRDSAAGIVNNQQESWHFKLDKVLVNASQEQVFDGCAREVVRSVMDGYNGTIMCYGQTGAGKTHTMTGGHVGFADRGIIPRAISLIYSEAAARPESSITMRLSYVEIYNELMFDLLSDVGFADQSGDLAIIEDTRGNVQVRGLSMPMAGGEEEALHTFFHGDTNRHVAEHALNKASTRSHVIFTIHIESRSRVESSEKVITSKLHMVDLAGSERVKKTGTDGVMLKEATYINKSLTFLEQVVQALGNKHRDHVPYRQSKLTHLLKDSLGGNCKTVMVANIWPEASMIEETNSTLRFATRMMRVSNEATVNVQLDPQLLIRKYERQIKDLKQELAMHDTLAGRSRVQYEEYAPDEQKELETKVKMYLDGEVQDIEVQSLRMVYETFGIFRKLHQQLRTELQQRPVIPAAPEDGAQAGEGVPAASQEPEQREGEVGEDEEGKGISVGVAPAGSRPPMEDRPPPVDEQGQPIPEGERTEARTYQPQPGDDQKPPDKQTSFAEWKAREGQVFEDAFEKNRADLKEKRAEMKDALTMANSKKKEIDAAKESLARKRSEKGREGNEETDFIDDEEFAMIKSLKDAKNQYKEAFERHRVAKTEVIQIEHLLQSCKTKLVQAFEEFYDQTYGHLIKNLDAAARSGDEGERYDPQEQFDLMEAERLETQHPDALAYHNARKNA